MNEELQSPEDETSCTDPGIKDFSKHLPEDYVSYNVYLAPSDTLTQIQVRSRLRKIQDEADELSRSLLRGYIWQREGFQLSVEQEIRKDTEPARLHLHGKTEFGDSIADEWVIVYILRELSRKFKDAWIRVVDADGEFLLAEAANAIPRWIEPDVAENRVWINDGCLKIVPQRVSVASAANSTSRSSPEIEPISLESALSYLASENLALISSSKIDDEAFYRLRTYPGQIKESMHTARVSLPRKLAYVLSRRPANISAAVDAFYLRDPISMRQLKTQNPSDSAFPPKDFVTTSVKFTRVSYAQLKSQEVPLPPAWFAPMWEAQTPKDKNQLEMGMKVTCGFEMLLRDPQNQDRKPAREVKLLLEDIDGGEEALPTDDDVSKWSSGEDSEEWLDINYEEFEKELSTGRGNGKRASSQEAGSFGNVTAQENLRRMVDRFEKLLEDEDDDAQFEDDPDSADDENEGTCRKAEKDTESLSPLDLNSWTQRVIEMQANSKRRAPANQGETGNRMTELEDEDEDDEDQEDGSEANSEDIKFAMDAMEAEFLKAGILDPEAIKPDQSSSSQTKDLDPRLLLARNILENFDNEID